MHRALATLERATERAYVPDWPIVCNEERRTMSFDLTKPGTIAVDAFNKETGEMKQYILKVSRRGVALL